MNDISITSFFRPETSCVAWAQHRKLLRDTFCRTGSNCTPASRYSIEPIFQKSGGGILAHFHLSHAATLVHLGGRRNYSGGGGQRGGKNASFVLAQAAPISTTSDTHPDDLPTLGDTALGGPLFCFFVGLVRSRHLRGGKTSKAGGRKKQRLEWNSGGLQGTNTAGKATRKQAVVWTGERMAPV